MEGVDVTGRSGWVCWNGLDCDCDWEEENADTVCWGLPKADMALFVPPPVFCPNALNADGWDVCPNAD